MKNTLQGFNPCFSGFGVIIDILSSRNTMYSSFNPCFSGFGVIISDYQEQIWELQKFQSLF